MFRPCYLPCPPPLESGGGGWTWALGKGSLGLGSTPALRQNCLNFDRKATLTSGGPGFPPPLFMSHFWVPPKKKPTKHREAAVHCPPPPPPPSARARAEAFVAASVLKLIVAKRFKEQLAEGLNVAFQGATKLRTRVSSKAKGSKEQSPGIFPYFLGVFYVLYCLGGCLEPTSWSWFLRWCLFPCFGV